MAHRTFTEGHVEFTIEKSLTAKVDSTDEFCYTKAGIHNLPVWPYAWTDNMKTPGLEVRNGQIEVDASVKANVKDLAHLPELKRWSVHFLQNVNAANRSASYTPGNGNITEIISTALPVCDKNEKSPKPFTTNDQVVSVDFEDAPFQRFPLTLSSQDKFWGEPAPGRKKEVKLEGDLTSTHGGVKFTLWLVLMRKATPGATNPAGIDRPCLILIDSLNWHQDFTLVKKATGWPKPPPLVRDEVVDITTIQPVYTYRAPGPAFPDVRKGAAINEHSGFSFTDTRVNNNQPVRWIIDPEESVPVPYRETPPIADKPNFFQR